MRQAIFIISLFCLLLFILLRFTVNQRPPEISVEAFIGQDVMVVVTQRDLEKRLTTFFASPLGLTLAGLDYASISHELGLEEKSAQLIDGYRKKIIDMMSNPVLRLLAGKEITLALYPLTWQATGSWQQAIQDNLLFISHPGSRARIAELSAHLIYGPMTEARYGGYLIKRFPVQGNRILATVRIGSLVLCSYNERLLRHSLDLYDSGQQQLREVTEYSDMLKSRGHFSSFMYVDLKSLAGLTRRIIAGSEIEQRDVILARLSTFSGLNRLYVSRSHKKSQISDKAIISYNAVHVNPEYRRLFAVRPVETFTYRRVGPDTIWYYWTNGFKPRNLLERYEQQQGGQASLLPEFFAEIQSITGMKPAELAVLFEGEVTVAVKEIREQQFVPVPRFMMCVKVKDPAKLAAAFKKILQHYDIPINTRRVRNVLISSWGGIIGESDVQPTYAFVGDYLLVASNREQIKEFIVLPEQKKSLDKNEAFRKVKKSVAGRSNAVGFLQVEGVVHTLKEIVSWGGTMLAIKDREAARKSKILIDQLINPLLEGMTMYATVATRNYSDDRTVHLEATTIIKD